MQNIKIFFDEAKIFQLSNIKPLIGIVGLYFIFLNDIDIPYPFGASRLIYVGMSEKKTNSIGTRLSGHYDGQSGNVGLVNYRKAEDLRFTYLNFEMLRGIWKYRIEDLESFFILDFVSNYGVYPICNNRTGSEVLTSHHDASLTIDWSYFEKKEESING
jgi:hypothetical protein